MAAASKVNSFLRHILLFLLRRPLAVGALLVLALAAALFAVFRADFENDIARMLPDGSESARAYRKIADSAMFNKAMILLSADSPAPFSTPEFAEKCRALAERLRKCRPEILRVDCELFRGTPMESLSGLFAYVPLYTTPAALPPAPELARRTMKQLLLPSSTGRAAMIQLDPAGLLSPVYGALNRFRTISGFSAAMDSPFLMTEDHKHLLINIETSLPVSDPESGRRLLAILEPALAETGFAQDIKSELILPHRRAIANEQVVKNDIGLVTLFSIILLPLLVIFVYRGDPRSLLLPAVPFLAALLTAALTVLIFPRPQLFAIGIGGVIIGVALDYGIHIYSAMNTRAPIHSLCRLLPPLLLSTATSCAAFGLFLFSPMEAIRQLGFFAGTSLLLSLILMLVLLPPVLRGRRPAPELPLASLENSRRHPCMIIAIFVSAALLAILFLPRLQIRADVRQYDMSPAGYDELERKVPALFQTPGVESSMALFGGKTRDEALRLASGVAGLPEIFSVAELLPPEELRQKHLAEWRKFPLEQYRAELRTAGKKLGFQDGYFECACCIRSESSGRVCSTSAPRRGGSSAGSGALGRMECRRALPRIARKRSASSPCTRSNADLAQSYSQDHGSGHYARHPALGFRRTCGSDSAGRLLLPLCTRRGVRSASGRAVCSLHCRALRRGRERNQHSRYGGGNHPLRAGG